MGSTNSTQLVNPVTFKCHECHARKTVEYSRTILEEIVCPRVCCRQTLSLPMNCKRCSTDFCSTATPVNTKSCIILIEYSGLCEACREYRDCDICGAETLKRICNDCIKTRPSCTCCGEQFKARFEVLHGERYCGRCARTVKKLIGNQPIVAERLEVTYEKKCNCEKATEFKRIYPITSKEIDLENYQLIGEARSDYCHGKTSYRILSSRLI